MAFKGVVSVWSADQVRKVLHSDISNVALTDVKWARDGSRAVVGDADGNFYVVEFMSGTVTHKFPQTIAGTSAISNDGNTITVFLGDGRVKISRAGQDALIANLSKGSNALSFDKVGGALCVSGKDGMQVVPICEMAKS